MTKKLLLTSAVAMLFAVSGASEVQARHGKKHHKEMGKCYKDMEKKEEMKAMNQKDCDKQKGHWEEMKEEKKEEMKEEMKEEKKD